MDFVENASWRMAEDRCYSGGQLSLPEKISTIETPLFILLVQCVMY